MVGAFIEKGPQNWQIIQQKDGFANIDLSGKWTVNPEGTDFTVYARVVDEDTGVSVIRWQPCKTNLDGTWEHSIKGVPVGGLYRIETYLKGKDPNIEWSLRGDMIHHIGVGDLYVIAGQSNSAGYGRDAILDAPELGVHLYRNNGKWDLATHPMNDATGTIHEVNAEGGDPGTSPYLSFAKLLKRELNYPIGLIQASLGGSPLSWWNPDEDPKLYNNMIDCINNCGGKIKGVLWYQGCSDCNPKECRTYLDRFMNMVHKFRKQIGDCVPFLTIQINRVYENYDFDGQESWTIIRDVQRVAAQKLESIIVIPTLDLTLSDSIHNSSSANVIIGERLAKSAIYEIYKKGNPYKAPVPSKVKKIEDKKVVVTFYNVYQRLYSVDNFNSGIPFTVVDDLGEIPIETATLTAFNSIELTLSREIKSNPKLHCGFGNNPKGLILVDFETFLPILAFYNLPIE